MKASLSLNLGNFQTRLNLLTRSLNATGSHGVRSFKFGRHAGHARPAAVGRGLTCRRVTDAAPLCAVRGSGDYDGTSGGNATPPGDDPNGAASPGASGSSGRDEERRRQEMQDMLRRAAALRAEEQACHFVAGIAGLNLQPAAWFRWLPGMRGAARSQEELPLIKTISSRRSSVGPRLKVCHHALSSGNGGTGDGAGGGCGLDDTRGARPGKCRQDRTLQPPQANTDSNTCFHSSQGSLLVQYALRPCMLTLPHTAPPNDSGVGIRRQSCNPR